MGMDGRQGNGAHAEGEVAGRPGWRHRVRGGPDPGAVRDSPAAAAEEPVRRHHHGDQPARPAQVDHRAEPLRGGQRLVRGRGGPHQARKPDPVVPGGQRDAVHRAGHRHRLHRFLAAEGKRHHGQRGPDRGDGRAPQGAARAGRAERVAVVRVRRTAGALQPHRQLLLRQPEQPAAGLRPGGAEDPDRRPAEPAARAGAEEHRGDAHRHAHIPRVQAGHGHLRRGPGPDVTAPPSRSAR